jgi:uncharacterized protein YggE
VRAIACIGLAALLGGVSGAAAQDVQASAGRLRAIGRSSVEVSPDLALVQVGVSTKAATPSDTLDQNSAAARRVVDYARGFGIAANDIRTASVNLGPVTKNVRNPGGDVQQQPDGYRANNSVQVRLRDLAKLGEFTRRVLDHGANQINSVSFGLSDPDKPAEEARQAAVADAVRKARGLADAAGVRLGRIDQISFPPRMEGGTHGGDGRADMPMRSMAQSAMSVPVEGGVIEVAAEVDVTWIIAQP